MASTKMFISVALNNVQNVCLALLTVFLLRSENAYFPHLTICRVVYSDQINFL